LKIEKNVNTLKSHSFTVLPSSMPEFKSLDTPVIARENWLGTLMTIIKSLKFENMIAGISGGTISTLVLHPLDLLKIRFAGTFSRTFTFNHTTILRK